jgi:hypothetical protein
MAKSHLDPLGEFGNSVFEETTADVLLDGRDFGPTTRVFGLRFHVKWQEFEASFYVGGGGNNARGLGDFRVKLPPDFSRRTVLEAVLFLEGAAIRAGIESYELRYVSRPPALSAQDVRVQLFQSPNHQLRWPGEPNHDEEVAARVAERWKKLHPIICFSPDQVRVEAQNRAAVAALSAEWDRLHAPIHSSHELRSRGEMKARALLLIRVNDLARELKVNSKVIVDAARHVGIRRRVRYSDSLGKNEADRVRSYLRTPAVRSDCA